MIKSMMTRQALVGRSGVGEHLRRRKRNFVHVYRTTRKNALHGENILTFGRYHHQPSVLLGGGRVHSNESPGDTLHVRDRRRHWHGGGDNEGVC